MLNSRSIDLVMRPLAVPISAVKCRRTGAVSPNNLVSTRRFAKGVNSYTSNSQPVLGSAVNLKTVDVLSATSKVGVVWKPLQSRAYKTQTFSSQFSFSSPHNIKNIYNTPSTSIRFFSTTNSIMSDAKPVTVSLDPSTLSSWSEDLVSDVTTALASTVIANQGAETALVNRNAKAKGLINVYSNAVTPDGAPTMNQKASGRCWLFAGTSQLRIDIMRRLNLSELELSPSYLFFYDKLEKANFFLEQIEQTADQEVESRLIQHLLTDPVIDGGQYDMFKNVVLKYGLVPNSVYGDSFNTLASRNMNYVITTMLRQYAQEIREAIAAGSKSGSDAIKSLRNKQIQHIHKLLCTFLGTPPNPTDKFTWEYVDKDKKYHALETTPLDFYKDVAKYDVSTTVSLLNDPRNPYNKLITVDRLGNIAGEPYVTYINAHIDVLAATAIKLIKDNVPVFFGTHTPIYHNKKAGIIDTQLWDYKLMGFDPVQNKADRLRYHQSLMTHAMLFTAVHLDPKTGEPVRWRVENSWGTDSGIKGYYIMSHEFFKEYVYQIVAQKDAIEDKEVQKLVEEWDTSKAIVLPPWDPCGALAKL